MGVGLGIGINDFELVKKGARNLAIATVIGIATSLFTAIFITRIFFESRLDKNKPLSFSTKLTEGAFKNINFDFSDRNIFGRNEFVNPKTLRSDPGTTRTFDPQLRRLLLYPLSYGALVGRKYNSNVFFK